MWAQFEKPEWLVVLNRQSAGQCCAAVPSSPHPRRSHVPVGKKVVENDVNKRYTMGVGESNKTMQQDLHIFGKPITTHHSSDSTWHHNTLALLISRNPQWLSCSEWETGRLGEFLPEFGKIFGCKIVKQQTRFWGVKTQGS